MLRTAMVLAAVLVAVPGMAEAAARRPDLALTKVSSPPASVTAGRTLALTATVRNAGRRRAPANRLAAVLSKDTRVGKGDLALKGTRNLPALKPRKTAKVKLSVTVPASVAPGTYRLIVCADARHAVKEAKEGNDCRATGLVRVVGGVDAPAPQAPAPVPSSMPAPGPQAAPAGDPLGVGAETLDTAHAATQRMIVGTLTTTAADGTKYTLSLPSGALVSSQDITMTPVSGVAGDPLGALVGAVHLEPDGLQLLKPATLRIEPPGGAPADATAFQYQAGGNDFHLSPTSSAAPLTLGLTHFSTPGVAHATPAQVAAVLAHAPVRSDARLEQSIAALAGDPGFGEKFAALMADHYDKVVKPALQTASTSDGSDAEQAVVLAVHWARQAALFGAGGGPREDEMWQLVEIVIRNAVDKGFHACHDGHDLTQIVRLMELQRFALLLGLDIGDAFGKALACAHFEINFDGRLTETDAWTGGDGRTFSLDAAWEMGADRIPVDISGSGTGPLTWRDFAFHSVDTLPGSSCTLTTTTDGTTTKNTTVSAQLEMDLTPRETPPAGQPAPPPRASYLRLQPSPGGFDLESYHRQNSGCSSTGSDSTNFNWISELGGFHHGPGEAGNAVRIKLNPATQSGDLLDAEHITAGRDISTSHHAESTFIEIFHTPQAG